MLQPLHAHSVSMNNCRSKIILPTLFAALFLLAGCLPSPYYQKTAPIPQSQWEYGFQPSFKFEIKDTTAFYNLYFLIRHTEVYPFSNIWLQVNTKMPGDSVFQHARIEIPLAEPTGKWLGRGMGDIWEQRMPISRNDAAALFKKAGVYEIKFVQDMRVNPLPEILQVGLRIEKIGSRKKP